MGVINILIVELVDWFVELVGDCDIVVYCCGVYCVMVFDVVCIVCDVGWEVKCFDDGMFEW